MVDTFQRPSYIDPAAVPVAWAVPIESGPGRTGPFKFSATDILDPAKCARLISGCLCAEGFDSCAEGTFQLSESDFRSTYFYGGITAQHAESIITKLIA